MRPEIVHKDGSLWIASYRSPEEAVSGLFRGKNSFFFREVSQNPKWKFWTFWRKKWVLTGRTWHGVGRPGYLRENGFFVLPKRADTTTYATSAPRRSR